MKKGTNLGKSTVYRTEYEAFSFRERYSGINQQNYLEKVENDLKGIQVTDYSIENSKEVSKPVVENFNFTTDNECEMIGDKMYINPKLFFTQTKNPFVSGGKTISCLFWLSKTRKTQFEY